MPCLSTLSRVALIFGVGSALLACPLLAEQTTIPASQDTTLYSEDTTRSCGAGGTFISGLTNDTFVRRAALAFDITSAVPAGSVINGVSLQLVVDRTRDNDTITMGLHRVDTAWGEGASNCDGSEGQGVPAATGDATWTHTFFATQFWATAGGDYQATASATALVAGRGSYTWSGGTLVADVQSWLDNPSTNFGWILIGDEASGAQTTRRFGSRENSRATDRPMLTIDFTPPLGAEACCTAEGFCTLEDPAACSGTVIPGVNSCSPNPCNQPQGACCLPDATCQVIGQADCADQGGIFNGEGSTCSAGLCAPATLTPYVDELPVPQILQPVSGTPGGAATYDVEMVEVQQRLHSDLPPTTVWAYEGLYPGPTIETTANEQVIVNWINNLRDSNGDLRTSHYLPVDQCAQGPNYWQDRPRTVVHLHGAHVPWRFDGHPDLDYGPGTFDTYTYPNNQLPTTLWYHDHALGITRLNVYMGLAGFWLIRDAAELSLGLPSGEFEVPLVIQDRSFNSDGSWQYPAALQQTFFGDNVLVNGKVWPFFLVKQGKYRFRLLNGSNSRVYTLSLSNGASFELIGTDGGLIDAPVSLTELTLAPAERADIVIDFEPYSTLTEIELTNSAPIKFPNPTNPTEGIIPQVMKFVVTAEAGNTAPLPATLRTVDVIPESEATVTRRFNLRRVAEPCAGGEWLIESLDDLGNVIGSHWDDITEFPILGSTEIWEFINDTNLMHPMHVHLEMFQVLERIDNLTGQPVALSPYEDAGWKDTVMAMPNTTTRIITRFNDYPGKFAYHCHILEHEDHEMMRQFRATFDPGLCNLNGLCETGEDCFSCADCGSVSGAFCGNGLCETGDGENCITCPDDCNGRQRGNQANQFCCGFGAGNNPVDCSDARCTSDGFFCRVAARNPACCGDMACEGSESEANCAVDCAGGGGCVPESSNENGPDCSDGIDNDCDGFIDGADPDCGACTITENPELSCSDGQDNDCDGLTDGDDPDCAGACVPDGKEKGPRCSDGIDNDCDGLIDGADPDC